MTRKLLIGASVLALSVLGATAASANPENIFSYDGYNYVDSYAATVYGDATSESYNTNQNAISYQTMSATSYGNSVSSYYYDANLNSGSATVSGGNTTSGVSVISANSGNGSVVQQGVSLSALGTVNVGN